MTLTAKYPGTCPFCGFPLRKGDLISKKSTPSGVRWGHATCPKAVEAGPASKSPSAFNAAFASAIEAAPVVAPSLSVLPSITVKFTPSKYQQDVFDFIKSGLGHGVIEAVAGSGKTTTITQALAFTPEDADVGFIAFNKHIADELKNRAPAHVKVSTLHALGLGQVAQNVTGRIEVDDLKLEYMMNDLPGWEVTRDMRGAERISLKARRSSLRKLVALAKATIVQITDWDAVIASGILVQLVDQLELGDEAELCVEALPAMLSRSLEGLNMITFDDMTWLPVVMGIPVHQFDWLFIDEAQDLNPVQIAFVLRSVKPTGRIIAVGDRKQSLYGFRGADVHAIPNIIKALNATVLPLSITYRCPTSHVLLAKELVPQIEAASTAKEGEVITTKEEQLASLLQDGDMAICRVNAPLVSIAFGLIRKGVKATIRGRDIGKGLVDLVKKFDAVTVEQLEVRLEEFANHELARLLRRDGTEMQQEALKDKVGTLLAVAADCMTVKEVEEKLLSIFSDEVTGVVLSSVHRSKGLEAERVFILKPGLLPHPRAKTPDAIEQENNCRYVAITRSKDKLYFVEED